MYHEFSGDPSIQCLAFEDQRHFVMVLCFKADGFLDREMPNPEFRHRAISKALGLDPVAGADALRRLAEVGLIREDWQPVSWEKRQFKSDNSTSRVQKWRSKSSEEESKKDIDTDTEGNVTSNVSETLHKKKSASRLPEDWRPTDELNDYAAKNLPNVDLASLAESFIDHWKAKSGADARKADWSAAWRTWVRNALKWGYPLLPLPPQVKGKREPTPEQLSEAQRKAAEDNRRQLEKVLGSALR